MVSQILQKPLPRVCVRVECENGNHWTTEFNGTFADAFKYFFLQTFVREDDSGKETKDVVVNVVEVK